MYCSVTNHDSGLCRSFVLKKSFPKNSNKRQLTMMMMTTSKRCIAVLLLLVWSTLSSFGYAGTTADGLAFLAKKKEEPGVVETASGLLYKEIRPGTGKSPTISDPCSCHYVSVTVDQPFLFLFLDVGCL